MKRTQFIQLLLLVSGAIIGGGICFLVMILIPSENTSGAYGNVRAFSDETDSASDNLTQIKIASDIARALYEGDYKSLSVWVSPGRGVTVVPFSTVDFSQNITFTAAEIRELETNKNSYIFGIDPQNDKPITLTAAEFFRTYMQVSDFSAAPMIGINRIIRKGNAVENVAEIYSDCVFIDLYYPPSDPAAGVDWISMKVVLEPGEGSYALVALVRGVYTSQ